MKGVEEGKGKGGGCIEEIGKTKGDELKRATLARVFSSRSCSDK